MLKDNLFEKVLKEPAARDRADNLFVVSGYATAAMGLHHLEQVLGDNQLVKVHLIVGMCPFDGIAASNHKAFQQLVEQQYPHNFECSYVVRPPAVHSKTYAWFKGDTPIAAFVGSANYSQNAFRALQKEVMEASDPVACRQYYESLLERSLYCTNEEVEQRIRVFSDLEFARRRVRAQADAREEEAKPPAERYAELPSKTVSLLDNNGELPTTSGLNWGQRPGREPNQAYIRLPIEVARTDFFPPRATHFTVLTDDEKVLICTRAQDDGKAIETPQNNSLIGEYFRNRIGVAFGKGITKEDLIRYGRTDVSFFKIDDETYLMDFSTTK